eukprot:8612904-Pyramimonas_sp.AAC.1
MSGPPSTRARSRVAHFPHGSQGWNTHSMRSRFRIAHFPHGYCLLEPSSQAHPLEDCALPAFPGAAPKLSKASRATIPRYK